MLRAVATRHRSRAAILFGGLLAIATLASVASSGVRAQGFLEAFHALFGATPTAPQIADVGRPAVNRLAYAVRPKRRVRTAVRRAPGPAVMQRAAMRQSGTSQPVCVRLCDGYAFPLGTSYKRANMETQEAACAAICPGAETALYVGAPGADGIAPATAARDGRSYSSLPTALAYTKIVSKTCVCGAPAKSGNDLMAVLRDLTLRRGDAVMTSAGFQIFAGLKDSVHNLRDFRPLARSPDIDNRLRGTLHKLEVASLAAALGDGFVALEAPASQLISATRIPGFQALN